MTARPVQSLRVRLVLGLSLTICLVWSGVAIWQFTNMQRELRTLLDDRLIASARMVVGIVQQFQQAELAAAPRASNDALLSVIGRDGVACEVSLVRSEVDILPIARTNNIPDMASAGNAGFGQITKGGKQWRTYVLEDKGVRVATADRLDVRDQLVQTFVRTLVLPFVLALAVILLLTWWMGTRSLRPLQRLREELVQRPPHDPTPVQSGRDVKELAPLVDSLNQLLARMDASMEHERRWTADAAHELRTPLTAIKTHVQVAQLTLAAGNNNASPDKAANALRQAGEGIDHMHATLEQLLQLARVESASAGEARATVGTGIAQAFRLACSQSLQRAKNEGIQLPSPPLDAAEIPADPAAWQAIQLPLPPRAAGLRHHQPDRQRAAPSPGPRPCERHAALASRCCRPGHGGSLCARRRPRPDPCGVRASAAAFLAQVQHLARQRPGPDDRAPHRRKRPWHADAGAGRARPAGAAVPSGAGGDLFGGKGLTPPWTAYCTWAHWSCRGCCWCSWAPGSWARWCMSDWPHGVA